MFHVCRFSKLLKIHFQFFSIAAPPNIMPLREFSTHPNLSTFQKKIWKKYYTATPDSSRVRVEQQCTGGEVTALLTACTATPMCDVVPWNNTNRDCVYTYANIVIAPSDARYYFGRPVLPRAMRVIANHQNNKVSCTWTQYLQ